MLDFHYADLCAFLSMSKILTEPDKNQTLFRQAAVRSAGYRLFGEVALVVPPSTGIAVMVSFGVVLALVAVLILVEVPQRSTATGVVMPAGGLTDVVASQSGRVDDVLVRVGDVVSSGDLLMVVASGDGSTRGQAVSKIALQSLRKESELRISLYTQGHEFAQQELVALNGNLVNANQRLENGRTRQTDHDAQLSVLVQRLKRRQELLKKGHIAQDVFDIEYSQLLSARVARAEALQHVADLEHQVREVQRARSDLTNQMELDAIAFNANSEQMRRDIAVAEFVAAGEYRSSGEGVVAHVLVQPGVAVNSGQILAKLRQTTESMEAWLYVSTATARMLQPGQVVEIRLDAYPQQVFGTFAATVSSVSGVALLPHEVNVPLLIKEPVFEVRASLDDRSLQFGGVTWVLQPGTSFKAEIIKRRLRLYQWLLRSLNELSIDKKSNRV